MTCDTKNSRDLPLGYGGTSDPQRKPVQAINDALATRANFVRRYMQNPYSSYIDPVLRHHLGLPSESETKNILQKEMDKFPHE
ncbi:MAG: hypothetical protein WDO18_08695 [Acidobacteriota bacterium]